MSLKPRCFPWRSHIGRPSGERPDWGLLLMGMCEFATPRGGGLIVGLVARRMGNVQWRGWNMSGHTAQWPWEASGPAAHQLSTPLGHGWLPIDVGPGRGPKRSTPACHIVEFGIACSNESPTVAAWAFVGGSQSFDRAGCPKNKAHGGKGCDPMSPLWRDVSTVASVL